MLDKTEDKNKILLNDILDLETSIDEPKESITASPSFSRAAVAQSAIIQELPQDLPIINEANDCVIGEFQIASVQRHYIAEVADSLVSSLDSLSQSDRTKLRDKLLCFKYAEIQCKRFLHDRRPVWSTRFSVLSS